jgi:hypothetical protein
MHYLAWIEAHPNPRRCGHAGVSVRFLIDHGVYSATTVVWLVERYDAFVAKRRQNWLVRPNRPQVLYSSSARAGRPTVVRATKAPAAAIPKHRLRLSVCIVDLLPSTGSTILSLKRVSLISAKSAVAFATIQSRATQIETLATEEAGTSPQCRA